MAAEQPVFFQSLFLKQGAHCQRKHYPLLCDCPVVSMKLEDRNSSLLLCLMVSDGPILPVGFNVLMIARGVCFLAQFPALCRVQELGWASTLCPSSPESRFSPSPLPTFLSGFK